ALVVTGDDTAGHVYPGPAAVMATLAHVTVPFACLARLHLAQLCLNAGQVLRVDLLEQFVEVADEVPAGITRLAALTRQGVDDAALQVELEELLPGDIH